jgi:hypothetical protein
MFGIWKEKLVLTKANMGLFVLWTCIYIALVVTSFYYQSYHGPRGTIRVPLARYPHGYDRGRVGALIVVAMDGVNGTVGGRCAEWA